MFRSRFDEAFPKSAPSFGPQELEYDVTEEVPGSRAEGFLCATLGLLLNRKQDVKYATNPSAPKRNARQDFLTCFCSLGQDIITELWRKPLHPTAINGPSSGRARTLLPETAPLPP